MRTFAALFFVLFLTRASEAKEELKTYDSLINYDRMLLACPDKQHKPLPQAFSACESLVMEITTGLYRANLYRKGGGFSDLWLKTINETNQIIIRLKKEFPGVWEAQNCPMGDCRTF